MATPKNRLSRDQIVAAATELADRDGLDALSIRTIAMSLGVSPMALYRHVATKEEILDLVVGQMLTQESAQTTWPQRWEDILRLLAHKLRDLLRHHPVVLDTLQRRAVAGPHALDGMEHLLSALEREGVDADTAVGLYGNTVAFVFGHVALQYGREHARATSGRTTKQDREELVEQIAQLPTSKYPHVVAARSAVPRLFDDGQFEAGIERLIRSVQAELKR